MNKTILLGKLTANAIMVRLSKKATWMTAGGLALGALIASKDAKQGIEYGLVAITAICSYSVIHNVPAVMDEILNEENVED